MEQGQNQIKYCGIEERYVQEVEDLVLNSFLRDEITFRLCRNCDGAQGESMRLWVRSTVRAHDWRLSRLAVDAATGRVAGAMLCEAGEAGGVSGAMASMVQTGEAGRLVLGVLEQVGEGYDVFKELDVKKAVYINIGVVHEGYRRRGISLELRRQSIEIARQQGCQAALDDATSPYTRKALTKLGFHTVKFLPYNKSLLANASKVDVTECGPDVGVALMVRKL